MKIYVPNKGLLCVSVSACTMRRLASMACAFTDIFAHLDTFVDTHTQSLTHKHRYRDMGRHMDALRHTHVQTQLYGCTEKHSPVGIVTDSPVDIYMPTHRWIHPDTCKDTHL